ncbi:MAG: hypothetical protein MUE88_05280 [Flavobacteriales bacterium]|jgi:hypothetical protein|nr:hypothetical protein [Flavobacteriales bacterium]
MRTAFLLFTTVAGLVLTGCKKDDDPPPATGGGGNNTGGGDGDVYLCGSIDISGEPYARYWKNGQEVELNSLGRPSSARAIWADDDHVVVGGKVREQGSVNYQPCYWVDDQLFELDNEAGSSFCTVEDLFVVGGTDVHMAGHIRASSGFNKAMYWGGGSGSTELTDGSTDAEARGLCVVGNDVYVCGYVENQAIGGEKIATYWLNGNPVTLGTGEGDSEANDIRVVNGDVIVVGTEYVYLPAIEDGQDQALIWVNGVRNTLTANGGSAECLFVEGSTVYVGGMANVGVGTALPRYWANGNSYGVYAGLGGVAEGHVLDMHVRNGAVYTTTGDLYSNNAANTSANYGGMYGLHVY